MATREALDQARDAALECIRGVCGFRMQRADAWDHRRSLGAGGLAAWGNAAIAELKALHRRAKAVLSPQTLEAIVLANARPAHEDVVRVAGHPAESYHHAALLMVEHELLAPMLHAPSELKRQISELPDGTALETRVRREWAHAVERLAGVEPGGDVAKVPTDHYMPEADVLRTFVLHRNVLRRFLDRHPEIKPDLTSQRRRKLLPLVALFKAMMQDDRLAGYVKTERRIKRNMARLEMDAKYQRAIEDAFLGR